MKRFALFAALPAFAAASPAMAVCPPVTLNLPLTVLAVPQSTTTITDSSGATWQMSVPAFPAMTQTVTTVMTPATCGPPPPPTLASGTYVFRSGGMSWDTGCNPLGDYPTLVTNTSQQFLWNGSTLQNGGLFLVDANNGSAGMSTTGDNWTLAASGAGWTVQNARTSKYLGLNPTACYPPAHPMPMVTSNPPVWTVN
jgi:hypothetical protein